MIYCITVTNKLTGELIYTKALETSIIDEDELRLEIMDFVDPLQYEVAIDSEILDMEDMSADIASHVNIENE